MSNIQIQDVDQRVQYTATSSQTIFTVPFPFLANSDLVVYQNSTKLDLGASAGEYGVSGAGNPSGGTVTLVTGATFNDIITILGNQPIDRTSIYSATISNLTGSDLNNDFNREIIMLKQLWTTQNLLQLQYAPYAEVSQDEAVTRDRWLPRLAAKQTFRMNAAGTAFEAIDFDEGSGGAPTGAQYFLATADGALPSGVNFGALTTGLLKHTVAAGVSTPATAVSGTDYWSPGNTLQTDTLLIEDDIQHVGDLDNKIVFGTDTQDYQTGGSSRFDISDSGFRLGGANSRVTTILDEDNMASNSATALATQQSIKAYADLMLPLTGGTMSGNIDMGTNKVTNAAAPTLGSDYTTKNYVDNLIENVHVAADLATTANFAYTYDNGASGVGATLTAGGNGVVTIDGVSVVLNDRIIFKDQTNGFENGVYDCTTEGTGGATAVFTRAADYDEASDMQAGDKFAVVRGTANAATEWMMTQTAAITIGTTDITFVEMSNSGALQQSQNLADVDNPSTSRSNLGVAIGSDVQAFDATLQSISALGTAADKMLYTTGIDTWAEADITSFARTILDDADAATARATLGAAASGANSDITSMTGLTGSIGAPTHVNDANGNEVVDFNGVASAVNHMQIINAATGNNPGFAAIGDDANVGISFNAKGLGTFEFVASSVAPTELNWFEQTTNGANSINVKAPASIASNQTVTWKSASTGSPVLDTTDSDAWTDFSGSVGYTGFSADPATNVARYKRIGNIVFINIQTGTGTSNDTTFTITGLPFTSAGILQQFPMAQGVDNSAGLSGQNGSGQIAASSTTLVCVLNNNGSGWTASNNKAAQFSLAYECV